VKYPHTS